MLQWLGWEDELKATGRAWFRQVMGPEKWLPASWSVLPLERRSRPVYFPRTVYGIKPPIHASKHALGWQ